MVRATADLDDVFVFQGLDDGRAEDGRLTVARALADACLAKAVEAPPVDLAGLVDGERVVGAAA